MITSILSCIRKHVFLSIFFTFLIVCLFLGDGQQMLIDIVGAGGVLLLAFTAFFYEKRRRELPVTPVLLWAFIIVYFCIRTFFSDDIGYSVFSTVRMIEAFLVFFLMYCYTDADDVQAFPKFLLGFCVFSLFASVSFMVFPRLTQTLPNTNLLVPTYGHNNIVDILLFGIPIAFLYTIFQKKYVYLYIFIALLFGMLLSFARGAMSIVVIFLIFASIYYRKHISKKMYRGIGSIGLVLMLSVGILFVFPQSLYRRYFPLVVQPKMTKSSEGATNRFEYFRQAITAIQERPLFGSGPGTFLLLSKKYQNEPGAYSRYAHNALLQYLSEVGVVGTLPLIFLGIWCGIHMWRAYTNAGKKERSIITTLFAGVVLQTLNASFDYSLSLFVTQLLFVSIFALLVSYKTDDHPNTSLLSSLFLYTSVILLFVFYIITSLCVMGLGKRLPLVSSCCFLSEYISLKHVQHEELITPQEISMITTLHAKNSVLTPLVSSWYEKQGNIPLARAGFESARVCDPMNFDLYKEYLAMLVRTKEYPESVRILEGLFSTFSSPFLRDFGDNRTEAVRILENAGSEICRKLEDEKVPQLYIAKLLYLFGLEELSTSPLVTKKFWELALRSYPNLGVLSAERASLELYVLDRRDLARVIIQTCNQNKESALHCSQIYEDLSNLTLPGQLQSSVLNHK